MMGVAVKANIGIGDGLQFSAVPENYFAATGKRLYDVSEPWFYDFNPYVTRGKNPPERTIQLWNFSPRQFEFPVVRPQRVYLSNAEIYAAVFKVPTVLNRPRLYRFEDYAFERREMILLHPDGKSHGTMPDHVLEHVIKKYSPSKRLWQIGAKDLRLGIPYLPTPTLWGLVEVISQAQMLIGMDSGPSWVAACYPDIVIKKLRTKPSLEALRDWVPLAVDNIHSHWDDRCQQIFNVSGEDVGFTSTYKKL